MDYVLYHHGIKGQKWGVRRFQKSDGSYTDAGKKRYGVINKQSSGPLDKVRNRRTPENFKSPQERIHDKNSARIPKWMKLPENRGRNVVSDKKSNPPKNAKVDGFFKTKSPQERIASENKKHRDKAIDSGKEYVKNLLLKSKEQK